MAIEDTSILSFAIDNPRTIDLISSLTFTVFAEHLLFCLIVQLNSRMLECNDPLSEEKSWETGSCCPITDHLTSPNKR